MQIHFLLALNKFLCNCYVDYNYQSLVLHLYILQKKTIWKSKENQIGVEKRVSTNRVNMILNKKKIPLIYFLVHMNSQHTVLLE